MAAETVFPAIHETSEKCVIPLNVNLQVSGFSCDTNTRHYVENKLVPVAKTLPISGSKTKEWQLCLEEEGLLELRDGVVHSQMQGRRSQRRKKYKGPFNVDEILPRELQEVIQELDGDGDDDYPWVAGLGKMDAEDPDFLYPGLGVQSGLKEKVSRRRRKTSQSGVECGVCGKVSPNVGELRKHQRAHSIEKPFKCPLSNCDFRTRHPHNVKHHMRSHTDERPWVCGICGIRMKTKDQLSSHQWRKHNDEKPLSCNLCQSWRGCQSRF